MLRLKAKIQWLRAAPGPALNTGWHYFATRARNPAAGLNHGREDGTATHFSVLRDAGGRDGLIEPPVAMGGGHGDPLS